jgi:protein-S-isoprenylcysteine O-methyltransferase Ste14
MIPWNNLIRLTWIALGAVWILAALRWRKGGLSVKTQNSWKHVPMEVICFYLLLANRIVYQDGKLHFLNIRLYQVSSTISAAGLLLTTLGVGVAAFARFSLGGNWSSLANINDEHTLTRTGPYRYVRHPIYSGFLLAIVGTAMQLGLVRGFLAIILGFIALFIKGRLEEELLIKHFGSRYRRYRDEVKMFIPALF